MDVHSAEGVEIRLRDGRTVLDFSSSIGVLGLGHNHPRILQAERRCHERKMIDALKVAPLRLQSALAYNLAQLLPDPLEVCFFTVSGAEAVEAGMKLCERVQGPAKTKYVVAKGSYHGKTHGSLSLTTSGGFQDGFLLGLSKEHVVEVPYGELRAIEDAIITNRVDGRTNSIIAIVLETIQGQGVVEPPEGYLKALARLCRENQILVLLDEVKVGMGRTGTFCAFESEAVIPDVLTLSKALGGGKHAIGAMITSHKLFKKAYGRHRDSALHSTTFGGLGESCAVAIETLNVFHEEDLLDRVRQKGGYLRERLVKLKDKHQGKIAEVRGRGLFQAVRFNFHRSPLARVLGSPRFALQNSIEALTMACLIRILYQR
ncbi:MAG: aspartate aminotransferase family protein, partial [Isosphaeraceae bacterium]